MKRNHYMPGIPSVTDLLQRAGLYAGFDYVNEPAYYFKRGNWVDAVCNMAASNLLAAGGGVPIDDIVKQTLTATARNNPKWDVGGWMGYVESYRKWLSRMKQYGYIMLSCQRHVINKAEGYQGTYDQLWQGVSVGLKTMMLLDLKTVPEGAHCPPSTPLQLAAYALCLDPQPDALLGLALQPDGRMPIENVYTDLQVYDDWRIICRFYGGVLPKYGVKE
jgi:hypothetical protein